MKEIEKESLKRMEYRILELVLDCPYFPIWSLGVNPQIECSYQKWCHCNVFQFDYEYKHYNIGRCMFLFEFLDKTDYFKGDIKNFKDYFKNLYYKIDEKLKK